MNLNDKKIRDTDHFQIRKKDLFEVLDSIRNEIKIKYQKKWLNIDELCFYTGYKKPTVYKYMQNKKIPHYKKEGRIFFKREEIDDWIESGKVEVNND